ncbi:Pectin acetylesterase [Rhynchospora pubera]|uniref:Pectin acetylesterase n=1 Tax=Rhynchospora pubera TaxID=906938 RepID=A0AAV8CXA4_9POAL|nr:Pectin acetylesterase [Rhynchospora pubera]KAJ4759011.1 Pectin acetylesterase [Rhynchospora pubera]KAJ4800001.1 Pectin acetylesterase [Rhynchospora pubera]KAJ4811456.1 Pectin acetylesterase [Rhynchospora pubera]
MYTKSKLEWTICSIVCLLGLLIQVIDGTDVPMTILKSAVAKGAVCLDGSPPAYHLDPGSGSGINNWIVHMEGGGWCKDTKECLERKESYRGSSKNMPPQGFSGMLGNVKVYNPDFYNWNRVKIRYCDGSSFTGDVEKVDPKTNLHYRGHRIFLAIIEDLLARGMNKAENALLSGCSAGGLASILNCDRFQTLLPKNATVKCFADAGFFIDGTDITGGHAIRAFYQDVINTHESTKNLPASCTSKHPPPLCFFPQYVVQTMRTPLFILNAAYDTWQVKNILAPGTVDHGNTWQDCKVYIKKCNSTQLTKFQDFRSEFLKAIPQNSSLTGMFIDSCYAHCQTGDINTWFSKDSPTIQNTTIGEAVGNWFFERKAPQKLIDCPYPCNPTCKNVELITNKN